MQLEAACWTFPIWSLDKICTPGEVNQVSAGLSAARESSRAESAAGHPLWKSGKAGAGVSEITDGDDVSSIATADGRPPGNNPSSGATGTGVVLLDKGKPASSSGSAGLKVTVLTWLILARSASRCFNLLYRSAAFFKSIGCGGPKTLFLRTWLSTLHGTRLNRARQSCTPDGFNCNRVGLRHIGHMPMLSSNTPHSPQKSIFEGK